MTDTLSSLVQRGVLSALDRHFARSVGRLVDEAGEDVLLAAALASRAVQHGHVCADLARLTDVPLLDALEQPVTDVVWPELDAWCEALRSSPIVGDGDQPTPLVLEPRGRLYLYRYARYQRELAECIAPRLRPTELVDEDVLREGLERWFPPSNVQPDLQRRAAEVAVRRAFCVISGGPGTGKTSTVARILALLQQQAQSAPGGGLLRIQLLAPTGKAAQRLGTAIREQLERMASDEGCLAGIPTAASTIHRALGYVPWRPTRFRHDADNPLPADVVLVDEASMVDLATMAKLAAAVPETTRLILLGDRDQLASVEAGAIFGDLCAVDEGEHEEIVHLTHSYRYDADAGIGRLARAIRAGDADEAASVLRDERAPEVSLVEIGDADALRGVLEPLAREGFGELRGGTPSSGLAKLEQFRLLCAHRRGPLGAEEVNLAVEQMLIDAGLLERDSEWYEGRPIMVTRNDYQLDLFNGDIGVIARDEDSGQLAAFFEGDEGLRRFQPARLPPHETVFATTVHKSQGSEFDHVVLVQPVEMSPVLTRELVYTGITRAKRQVTLLSSERVLREAIARRIDRASGLSDALWGKRIQR